MEYLCGYSDATVTEATAHAVAPEYPHTVIVLSKVLQLRLAVATAVLYYKKRTLAGPEESGCTLLIGKDIFTLFLSHTIV